MKVKFSEDVTQDDGVEFKKDKSYDLRDSSARHWINRNKALPDEKAGDVMAPYLASDKAQEKSEGTSPKPDLAHSVQEAQRAQRETTVQPKTPDRTPDPATSEGMRGAHSTKAK